MLSTKIDATLYVCIKAWRAQAPDDVADGITASVSKTYASGAKALIVMGILWIVA